MLRRDQSSFQRCATHPPFTIKCVAKFHTATLSLQYHTYVCIIRQGFSYIESYPCQDQNASPGEALCCSTLSLGATTTALASAELCNLFYPEHRLEFYPEHVDHSLEALNSAIIRRIDPTPHLQFSKIVCVGRLNAHTLCGPGLKKWASNYLARQLNKLEGVKMGGLKEFERQIEGLLQ